MSTTNLLELLLNLLRDPSAYREDPEGFLASCGDVSPEDIREALVLLQDRQDADFSREYNTGGNHVHVPPPPPAPAPEPGESNQEAAIRYLDTYVTNNYITNEGDTITDNSINQQIDTGGGDFDQDIDVDSVVASGDGSVAAGDDIEDSDITTGDDNIVGDDNVDGDDNTSIDGDDNEVVDGDDNTVGFGEGDTSSTEIDGDVSVDDGSSLAVDGSSAVDNSNREDNDTAVDASDNSTNDSGNTTADWQDTSVTEDNDSYSSYQDGADNSTYVDNDTTTTDSHASTQESYSAEVV
ncbi:hypothetical protein FHX44_113556 [Pseudonocardia hierapolitana]|uniref:Dentin sialophosphoprotein n=1 Tax=Pseudonocardia hierapolitana TaxID=1128676 RepID=A0A561SS25_9PSEU|nr:hypothetical protein [Pseudonocardia hierapolitana]TWF77643.1 hypothetical protein FHX44_113556 [Pseudonocardia hierapolitana]